ncbi:MAG TPA: extracellular solute-binding protein [Actinoplanes sp.]|nr:extracellular solute-binding protein [Actinoplanes sp.]
MSFTSRRLRSVAAVALTAGLALGTGACTKDEKPAAPTESQGPVTITLQYFGKPGFDDAVKAFQTANPNITVEVQNQGELKDFAPKLAQWLSAGKGAGDVVMLEEGQLLGYIEDHKNFANLYDLGANDVKGDYLPFKITNASTPDGSKLIGLGTDVGPLAMCYRADLFKKAGLPTNRDEVSALWPTWDDYAKQGAIFKSKVKDAAWLDSATSIMQPYIMQNGETWFYSKDNEFVGDTNPVVKTAWDFGLKLAADGLTGKLARWSPDWSASFKKGGFATQPCPPWMTGVIEGNAGKAGEGKWDIATIPGKGGNWGGSYLAVPAQSQHQKEAFKLAAYLTGPEGGVTAFNATGALPSNVKALDDPKVTEKVNKYFSNAPTGKIFAGAAKELKPIYLGPKHQALWENVYEPAMQSAEQGKATSDAAWAKATADGKKLAEG